MDFTDEWNYQKPVIAQAAFCFHDIISICFQNFIENSRPY